MFGLLRNKETEPIEHKGNIDYPAGVAVDDGTDRYLVKSRGLYRFGSDRIFESWSMFAGGCSPENIEHLKVLGVLGFRDGTLLSKFSDGTLHIVSNNKTWHIVDPDAMHRYSLLGRKIYEVSDYEFNLHDVGGELSG